MKKVTLAVAVVALIGAALVAVFVGRGVVRERAAKAREQERIELEARCRTTLTELRSWLTTLDAEGEIAPLLVRDPADRDRYLGRPVPSLALVRVSRKSEPVLSAAGFVLERRRIAFIDQVVDVTDRAQVDTLVARAEASGLSPEVGFGSLGRFRTNHPGSLFIGEDELWSDVVGVVAALSRKGFGPVNFVFAVESKVTPPPDNAATRALFAIATDQKQMSWPFGSSVHALAAANPRCPSLVEPVAGVPSSSNELAQQRAHFAARAPDAAFNCGCDAINVDAIKAFAWTRYGRHWGRLTAGALVQNERARNSNEPVRALATPATAKWRDVYGKIIEASGQPSDVTFAFAVSP